MSSAEEDEILDSVLRDRSHIDETLRLGTEENAGNYAGEENVHRLHISGCFKQINPKSSCKVSILNDGTHSNNLISFIK